MPHTAHLSPSLRLLRTGFRHLGPYFPGPAGRLAYRLWFSTQRYPEPGRERRWVAAARTDHVAWQGRELVRYQWGMADAPAVLLIHGWNGRGPQLGAFAAPLNDAGLRVVAFDAPGHGRSPGRSTNIFEFADAILTVARASGPVTGAVAHSFGVPACARALLQDWALPQLVAIAAPANAEFLLTRFARILDIPDNVMAAMRQRVERRFGMDIFARLATDEMLAGRALPGLIIHDRDDRDVPDGHAERLHRAWPASRLMLTDGLGHRRILRDHQVIAETVRFLRGEAAR
ncbi:MAG: alpha/beta fold hydrolase [Gammaproteobacteria bacterium]